MKLTLLGTAGGGTARLDRAGSASVVSVGEDQLLFDCGPSATMQILRSGLRSSTVGPVFLTHHHFDHTVDLAYFALSSWLSGRDRPLEVIGPAGTVELTRRLFGTDGAFDADLRARSEGEAAQRIYEDRHGRRRERMRVNATDIVRDGLVRQTENWLVAAARTPHTQPFMESYAYRIDADGRSVVISGDTAPSPAVEHLAARADVLVHECTRPDGDLRRLGLHEHHTGPLALGALAQRAGVRTVVMVHFSVEHDTPDRLAVMAADVARGFDGEVIIGSDLLELEV